MNFELTEETLEEGRFALHQLEKQLNQRNTNVNDNISATSSKMQSTTSERKILDQIPRNTRLNLRLESLGITVEVSKVKQHWFVKFDWVLYFTGIGRSWFARWRWCSSCLLYIYETERQAFTGTATKITQASRARKRGLGYLKIYFPFIMLFFSRNLSMEPCT
jgi:hypothetical protein